MFGIIDALIVRPLVNIFLVIYSVVGDFGLAIIIFTILVKLAMWPLMKKQLHQTRIMREIQPELAQIKKNAKGNRQLESMQMMDLYKRKNIKPFRSIGTVFIQLPIFIALFTAINVAARPQNLEVGGREYNVQHSAYSFVEKNDRVHDLISLQDDYFANPDNGYQFQPKLFSVVDLSAQAGFSNVSSVIIMLFALGSAAIQFIISRQQDPTRQKKAKKHTMRSLMREAANGKEASQEDISAVAQSQMTFMMPLMMLFIMFNLPGAVVFYYLLNNCITAVLQKVILSRNYTEMEAAADKQIIRELKNDEKVIAAQEAEIVKKDAQITRLKNQNKNKDHITRISASNKKKRR